MTTVGIRQLREAVGSYVTRAHAGERIIVTERGEPIAELGPLSPATSALLALAKAGKVTWSGRRFEPPAAARRVRLLGGESMAETVSAGRDDRVL